MNLLHHNYQHHEDTADGLASGAGLTTVETDPELLQETRSSALSLVRGAVSTLIHIGQSAPSDAQEAQLDAPLDLPGSPPMTVHEVGDAPTLTLEDAVAKDLELPEQYSGATRDDRASARAPGNTVLPAGWTFRGEIVVAENMTFDCNLQASVENTNPAAFIAMGPGARSEGVIKGKEVIIKGSHRGEIDASGGHVVIEASSQIIGEVTYTSLQMNGGKHDLKLQYVPE